MTLSKTLHCHFDESHYAECRVLFIVLLNFVMQCHYVECRGACDINSAISICVPLPNANVIAVVGSFLDDFAANFVNVNEPLFSNKYTGNRVP
jgi:hypothetical protein